jgi:hypothetical protein
MKNMEIFTIECDSHVINYKLFIIILE